MNLFLKSAFLWRDAVIAACVGCVLLSYIGFFVVLTRNAFAGAAVSQLAGLGVVVSFLLGAAPDASPWPLAAGLIFGVAGTALLGLPKSGARASPDAILATAVVGASAATILCARYLSLEFHHVQAALYGDAVVATGVELVALGAVASFVSIVHYLHRHRFWLIAFDPEAARAQGLATRTYAMLLGLTIGLAIAVTTKILGALTAFAFSVVPAAAALLIARSLRRAMRLAAAIALLSATGGYYLSFTADLPTGPTLAGTCLVCLGIAALGRMVKRGA